MTDSPILVEYTAAEIARILREAAATGVSAPLAWKMSLDAAIADLGIAPSLRHRLTVIANYDRAPLRKGTMAWLR